MAEETLVAGTQVFQACLSIWRASKAVFRTLTITHCPNITCSTVFGQSLQFGFSECALCRAFEQSVKRLIQDVSKIVLRVSEMITREEVTVVFDNRNVTTYWAKDAKRMILPECCPSGLLEYLNFDSPNVFAHPFIENGAQKSAPGISRNGKWADAVFAIRLRLNHR
jgi:hypothetical protein